MTAPRAYYNEHDPKTAAWLRELIKSGLIANGEVDERSIEDVNPIELTGFVQHHFFAGIGGWPYALRLAGWPDDRAVWTGSCPCQPFSAAGKGAGFADERHLWPAFHWLIEQCRPDLVFGEQVEGPDGRAWLDLVFSDLEGGGYACGAVVFPSSSVGAPHGRHRTYWVADASHGDDGSGGARYGRVRPAHDGATGGVADAGSAARQRYARGVPAAQAGVSGARFADGHLLERHCDGGAVDGVDDAGRRAGPTNGEWRNADWLFCRDGKWRPVEPGLEPLADGIPARLGRLRGYGNAICVPQAQTFIETWMSIL